MTLFSNARLALFALLLFSLVSSGVAADSFVVSSPDGAIRVEATVDGTVPIVAASFADKEVLSPSPVGFQFSPELEGGLELVEVEQTEADSTWTPVWGENESIRDHYRGAIATLRERGPLARTFRLEARAYDFGVAFRYLLPGSDDGWKIVSDATAFAFDPDSDSWPIFWTEDDYPKDPVKLGSIEKTIYPPLTLRIPTGAVVSTLEWTGDAFPRALLAPLGGGKIGFQLFGAATVDKGASCATPWRVLAVAADERALVENESFLQNLAPETQCDASERFQPGKAISNESNCDIQMPKLLSLVDFAAANGMKYLQIDWGWYGTEWRWSPEEQDKWAETNPELADDPDWRRNCEADPFTVAKGLVPYLPTWKSKTYVDLDIAKLVEYGREKGVGICLYVNDKMLKANDLDKLFGEYERWGLVGLKPGFVAYGDQGNEVAIEELIRVGARHGLWMCVHDAYLPNGFSRPWPNLMSVEGGGGQEGNHSAWHDVVLPFARCLAGPFDYTPILYCNGKSHAHQLSLLTAYFNPAPVFRGGWNIRDAKAEDGFGNAFGDEAEFLRRVETVWTQTRVLDAKIGRYLVVARRAQSGEWFFGATNGPEQTTKTVALDFLTPGEKFRAIIWRDADEERDGWRPTVREERVVESTDSLDLTLAPSGGAVAIFEPVAR